MRIEFADKNLRGRSFKGQNLSNADFLGCDIRGTNFANAVLINANFSHVRAGQTPSQTFLLSLLLSFFVFISGYTLAYVSGVIGSVMLVPTEQPVALWSGIVVIIFLIVYAFLIVKKGLGEALGIFILAITFGMVLIAAIGAASTTAAAIIQFVAIGGAIAGGIVSSGLLASLKIIARKIAVPIFGIFSILGSSLGGWEGIKRGETGHIIEGLPVTLFLSITLLSLSIFVGLQATIKNPKYLLINRVSTYLACWRGTSFRGADLTNADFTEAQLGKSDFRNAVLKRTCWFIARQLEQSLTRETYLDDPRTLKLVLTKDGRGQTFDRLDLRRLNLDGAKLIDASFINSDLSESTLQNADLSRAKLVQAKLYWTNLTGATLTGAYIQDWAISTDTRLEQIRCEHIHMRLPTQKDPDPWRKPDNRNETFQEGDFTDFIAPIIKTLDLYRQQNVDPRRMASTFKSLDLYHYGGIDPAAAAIALQQLAEENPEAGLEIVALEGRGEEKVRLQAAVTGETDSSQLNAKYFQKYREISSLPYRDIQALLAGAVEKDDRIRSLEKLLENALYQPKFYVETYQNKGEFIMTQSKGSVNISGVQGNVSGVAAAGENQTMTGVALGAISGSVTNTINQLPASPNPDNPGIKELLAQLQAAIEAESELPDEDKAEALEQVKTLAEVGQKPEDNLLQKAAKTSMKILKGTIASLPDTAKLAESCVKLLPAIATLLALV